MVQEQIINQEAYELGKNVTLYDRLLIHKKLGVTVSLVNKVLSGERRCIRGKSLEVLGIAEKLAKINLTKAELI